MQTKLNAYLSFRDNTREAMEFYQSIFGGKLDISTFKEYQASSDPSEDNKVMHAMLEADNGITFMASDTPNSMDFKTGSNFSLSLSGDNEAELTDYFNKLAEGGQIVMPLAPSPWSDKFGMLTDKFGVAWMVDIAAAKE